MNPIFDRKTPEKFQFPIEVKPNFLRGYPDCQMWTFEIEEERCSLYDEAGMQVFSNQLINFSHVKLIFTSGTETLFRL